MNIDQIENVNVFSITGTPLGNNCHTTGLHLEFSPESMPSSTIDEVEELFGCCGGGGGVGSSEDNHSNDCSCSDLLMSTSTSSLDLTIYGGGQIGQGCWSSNGKFPSSDFSSSNHQPYPSGSYDLGCISMDTNHHNPYGYNNGSPADSSWDVELTGSSNSQQQRVLSILEPGLDFEGLIDLDNL